MKNEVQEARPRNVNDLKKKAYDTVDNPGPYLYNDTDHYINLLLTADQFIFKLFASAVSHSLHSYEHALWEDHRPQKAQYKF